MESEYWHVFYNTSVIFFHVVAVYLYHAALLNLGTSARSPTRMWLTCSGTG